MWVLRSLVSEAMAHVLNCSHLFCFLKSLASHLTSSVKAHVDLEVIFTFSTHRPGPTAPHSATGDHAQKADCQGKGGEEGGGALGPNVPTVVYLLGWPDFKNEQQSIIRSSKGTLLVGLQNKSETPQKPTGESTITKTLVPSPPLLR